MLLFRSFSRLSLLRACSRPASAFCGLASIRLVGGQLAHMPLKRVSRSVRRSSSRRGRCLLCEGSQLLFSRCLDPRTVVSDRGPQSAHVLIPSGTGRIKLSTICAKTCERAGRIGARRNSRQRAVDGHEPCLGSQQQHVHLVNVRALIRFRPLSRGPGNPGN
jgi:hypothetical protein